MKILTFSLTISFLMVYSFIGGAIFMVLERDTEEETRVSATQAVQELMGNNTCLGEQDVLDFQDIVAKMSDGAVLMNDDSNTFYRDKFNIPSSIMIACCYFCGFGLRNMNPATLGGKIFAIFYLLLTSYYSFIMTYAISEVFDVLTMTLIPKWSGKNFDRGRFVFVRQGILITIAVVFFMLIPAGIIFTIEPWTFLETLYFCVVYLITLGFSDYMPGDVVIPRSEYFIMWYRMFVGFWVLIASLWVGIVMIHYSLTIGYFFWDTTAMAVDHGLETAARESGKKSKAQAIKSFLRRKREAFKQWRQQKNLADKQAPQPPFRFASTAPQTAPHENDYIHAVSSPRFESRYASNAPSTTTGQTNIIRVNGPTLALPTYPSTNLPEITYPRFSQASAHRMAYN